VKCCCLDRPVPRPSTGHYHQYLNLHDKFHVPDIIEEKLKEVRKKKRGAFLFDRKALPHAYQSRLNGVKKHHFRDLGKTIKQAGRKIVTQHPENNEQAKILNKSTRRLFM